MDRNHKNVGLEQGIDILMDPDSEYDVIIKEGEGIIVARTEDDASPIFDQLRKEYAAPKSTLKNKWNKIMDRLNR